MFVAVELSEKYQIVDYLAPTTNAGIRYQKFWYGDANEEVADFWKITFGVNEPIRTKVKINDILYNQLLSYTEKATLDACKADPHSYYWNESTQQLYVHLTSNDYQNTVNANFSFGTIVGTTNDKVRILNDVQFKPLLLEFPEISIYADKFNYDQASFVVSKIAFDNKGGFFNKYKNEPLYGTKVIIKTGNNKDTYDDLVERAAYSVEDYTFSASEFVLAIQDMRATLDAQIPNKVFTVEEYPNIAESTVGTIIPIGYGQLKDVPGFCINETVLDTYIDPVFVFLDKLGSTDMTVYVQSEAGVWVEQTEGVSVARGTGEVTVKGAKVQSDNTWSFLPVKATLNGIANTYASDVIKDLNYKYLNYYYDDGNYDTVRWEEAEQYLAPISLYMTTQDSIYNWIKKIQSLSSVGFRYGNGPDNRRNIYIDNPNKDIRYSIPQQRIFDIDLVNAKLDKDTLYNLIVLGYNQSIINNTYDTIENREYYDESQRTYAVTKVYNKVTGLIDKTTAENRAAIQAEDYSTVHREFDLVVAGEEYLNLELYDIIEAALTLYEREYSTRPVLQKTLNNGNVYQAVYVSQNELQAVLESLLVTVIGEEFFGTVRGQVTKIGPNYNTKTNKITLRERAYSSVWESIYG